MIVKQSTRLLYRVLGAAWFFAIRRKTVIPAQAGIQGTVEQLKLPSINIDGRV
ncbi:MAG TPA: hypothetical protein VF800_11155 [Telluria sp.]